MKEAKSVRCSKDLIAEGLAENEMDSVQCRICWSSEETHENPLIVAC